MEKIKELEEQIKQMEEGKKKIILNKKKDIERIQKQIRILKNELGKIEKDKKIKVSKIDNEISKIIPLYNDELIKKLNQNVDFKSIKNLHIEENATYWEYLKEFGEMVELKGKREHIKQDIKDNALKDYARLFVDDYFSIFSNSPENYYWEYLRDMLVLLSENGLSDNVFKIEPLCINTMTIYRRNKDNDDIEYVINYNKDI